MKNLITKNGNIAIIKSMGQMVTLKNGNIAIIKSIRYASNKCFVTFTIAQKDGYWKSKHSEILTIGYYNSVEDFILSNY